MQSSSQSLYTRLGDSTVGNILDSFDKKVLKDATLGPYFIGTDCEKTKTHAKAFLTHMFGGSDKYEGKSLLEGHKALKIQEGHFNYFVHLLRTTMLELKVDEKLANEATWLVEKYRSDIIDRQTLFERLGGEGLFTKLSEVLGGKILPDPVIGPIYSQTDFKKVNSLRMDYIKLLFGGKVDYSGKSLHESHSSHKLNDRHFNRFIILFEESLTELNVKPELVDEAVQELEKTRFKITDRRPLVEELGGLEALDRIVPKFHERILKDDVLRPFFDGVDIKKLNESRKHYFNSVWGGSHSYGGQSMQKAHGKVKLGDREFNLFLKHLYLTFMEEGAREDFVYYAIEVLDLTRDQVLNRPSVLERLGGVDQLTKVTEEFHQNLRNDKVLGPIYSKADQKRLVRFYVRYFAHMFGASDLNANTSLRSIHEASKLTDMHYNLFLDLLRQTLSSRKVDKETTEEAIRLLETKRNEVLQRESLWGRLGGYKTLEKIISKFEDLLVNDSTLGPMHQNIDLKKYHENHRDMFAELFNAWHFYSGKSLNEAHRPFKLTDEHFNLFVDLFARALKDSNINEELIGEVRKVFELTRNEVLNRCSLYEQLGGEKTIELLVEKLNQRLANDPVLGPLHKDVDWAKLQLHRKQFFTKLFGNLNVYEGKDLRSAHKGLKLSDEHFTIFEKHVRDTLGELGVSQESTKEALSLIETTKREVLNTTCLYDKLGGKQGMERFVTTLDQLSAKNPDLAPFFEKVDMGKLNERRLQYFTRMFGGQSSYEGKSMHSAHDAMPLSDKHMKIFLELVQDALKEIGADQPVKDEILMMFQTKRNEVINQ